MNAGSARAHARADLFVVEAEEIGFRGVVTDSNEGVIGNGGSGPEVVVGTS